MILSKLAIYIECFALLFIVHIINYDRLVAFFLGRKWRWIAISIIGFLLICLSLYSVDRFIAKDKLLHYQNVAGKISASDPNIILIVCRCPSTRCVAMLWE